MEVVCGKVRLRVLPCASFWSQVRGWMFRRLRAWDGLVLVFDRPRVMSLHAWFCFLPLDILYVGAQGKVLRVYKRVRPFTIFVQGVRASYIVEVKDARGIRVGDTIRFIRRRA